MFQAKQSFVEPTSGLISVSNFPQQTLIGKLNFCIQAIKKEIIKCFI
jgi:hypothetical protein